jgi:hypothetical protein
MQRLIAMTLSRKAFFKMVLRDLFFNQLRGSDHCWTIFDLYEQNNKVSYE